nr:UBN2 domain-containing protein [Tanacetum cinerariifolium]
MIQPLPIVSTQGMSMTLSAPRLRKLKKKKEKVFRQSGEPRELMRINVTTKRLDPVIPKSTYSKIEYEQLIEAQQVSLVVVVSAKEDEEKENVASAEKEIMDEEVDKMVKGEEEEEEESFVDYLLLNRIDPDTRLEPRSRKENAKEKKDDDDKNVDDHHSDDVLMTRKKKGSLEIRESEKQTPIPAPLRSHRTNLSLDKEHNIELMDIDVYMSDVHPHPSNSQVKDKKIDLLIQQYEQFIISEDESIDSVVARFNTIITSLKALDEGYSSKNYVKKFLRALHPKWRAKAKKESSDEESSTFESEDEEYAMAVRDFKKFFKRRGRCEDSNHLIEECLKSPRDKNQKDLFGGSWSDSGEEDDEKAKDKTCLMTHASSDVDFESSYFSDENSSIDGSLENEINELKEKLSKLKRHKEVDLECKTCKTLKNDNEKLKEEALKLTQFQKSTRSLDEMISIQKPFKDESGLRFNSLEASTSGTKKTKFVKSQNGKSSGGGLLIIDGAPLSVQMAPKTNQGLPVCSSKI